ncbi:MAG: hypothetical protein JWP68_419, partial [Modestobacter sp.]|nr:hypothetical protein [Modestobacter sp.]
MTVGLSRSINPDVGLHDHAWVEWGGAACSDAQTVRPVDAVPFSGGPLYCASVIAHAQTGYS